MNIWAAVLREHDEASTSLACHLEHIGHSPKHIEPATIRIDLESIRCKGRAFAHLLFQTQDGLGVTLLNSPSTEAVLWPRVPPW